jgi:hypothetical protein
MSRQRPSARLRDRVAARAKFRCGYCLTPELLTGSRMELDHLVPYSRRGSTDESNLWLACRECNLARSDRTTAVDPESGSVVRLFNPLIEDWDAHFRWIDAGRLIVGTTPSGRATATALDLNRPRLVMARGLWIAIGRHPPAD